jgi:hypothetical protein
MGLCSSDVRLPMGGAADGEMVLAVEEPKWETAKRYRKSGRRMERSFGYALLQPLDDLSFRCRHAHHRGEGSELSNQSGGPSRVDVAIKINDRGFGLLNGNHLKDDGMFSARFVTLF